MAASIGSTDHRSTNTRPGPPRSFYTFSSHDGTIKRFLRIAFPFTGFHFSSAFFANFDGAFGLMIPDGFGDPIAGFENPNRQAGPNTPHLTVGHTPWSFGRGSTSGRRAFAFASRGHSASTLATHGFGTVEGRFPGFIASRASAPSTGSATATATAGWGWTRGARRGAAHRRSPTLFIHGGHRIGMRDVANASPSSPFLRIFIQQIQPSP